MRVLRICILAVALSLTMQLSAQYYTTGADPWSVRFQQTRGNNYRIIADKQINSSVQLLSNIMDSIVDRDYQTLSYKPSPLDIIIHSRTAYSNGLVSWAPARAEFYSYSSQDNDCVPWLLHLPIHEYRHAVQTNSMKRGFTKAMYYIFGEQAIGFFLGAYVPLWYMEGDAVVQETALTHGGRGRSATFDKTFRAITLERERPTYDEAYNGSYRRWFPDYYHQGYLIVSATRLKYGAKLWSNVLERCARRSWSITPFNKSLRLQTGNRRVALYNESIDWWTTMWQHQDSTITPTDYHVEKAPDDDYDEYIAPHKWRNNIIACKTTPESLTRYVIIDSTGNESTIHIPSFINEADFDINGDKIVWCECRQHPRWENGSESCIMYGDIARHKFQRLTKKGYYASPAFSKDGNRIAVIMTDRENRTYLKILDTNGVEIASHEFRIGENITSPCWTEQNEIAYIATYFDGSRIDLIDNKLQKNKTILKASYHNRRHLTSDKSNLYFTSDSTGVENIYVISQKGNATPQRITSSRFGADWASVNNGVIYYSDYSSKGYQIVTTSTATHPTDAPHAPIFTVADSLTSQEGGAIEIDTILYNRESKNFSRWNVFNFHSWGPIIVDANNTTVNSGISITSQDLRGTTIFNAGMIFDKSYTDERYFVSLSYNAMYPTFTLRTTYGYNDYKFNGYYTTKEKQIYTHIAYDDRQFVSKVKLSISQPLSSAIGPWQWRIEPYASISYNKQTAYKYTIQTIKIDATNRIHAINLPQTLKYNEAEYTDVNYGIYLYWLRRTAQRDLGSRLGITADLIYRHTPTGLNMGSCMAVLGNIYLPGIGRHHQISITAQAQQKTLGSRYTDMVGNQLIYYIGDYVSTPRGYDKIANKELLLTRINYYMPIICPDWSAGGVFYLKRISAKYFYDKERGKSLSIWGSTSNISRESIGIELNATTHWLRLAYPVNIGYRCSYRLEDNQTRHEMLLQVSFK